MKVHYPELEKHERRLCARCNEPSYTPLCGPCQLQQADEDRAEQAEKENYVFPRS